MPSTEIVPPRRRSRFSAPPAVLVASAIVAGIEFVLCRRYYDDDAFITLRYARNLIAGNGLVWNRGEFVQGYTNFLHLMFVALLGAVGVDLQRATQVIGVASYLTLSALVWYVVPGRERDGNGVGARAIAVFLTATAMPVVLWAVGGLESVMFAAVMTGGILFLVTDRPRIARHRWLYAGGVMGIGTLVRPDAVVLIGAAVLWIFFTPETRSQRWKNIFVFACSAAVFLIPLLVWQKFYYGDIFPNTFYAKTGAPIIHALTRGGFYEIRYAFRPPFLPLVSGAAIVALRRYGRWTAAHALYAWCVAVFAVYVVAVGGDFMIGFRALLPIIPLMAILVADGLAALGTSPLASWRHRAVVVIVALSAAQLIEPLISPIHEDAAARVGAVVGKYIAHAWPPGVTIALNTAGSTPYFADANVYIDMLGLNDRHIAHQQVDSIEPGLLTPPGHLKADAGYVLARRPDYIIFGPAQGTDTTIPMFRADLQLARDPRFAEDYTCERVWLRDSVDDADTGFTFTYFRRGRGTRDDR